MKILIADDEPLAREHLSHLVSQLPGYKALKPLAENGHTALQLVATLKPDILLLNLNLASLDGLQVAAQLCTQTDAPAIIFCVAPTDYNLQLLAASAVDYLLQPITAQPLQTALAAAQPLSLAQLVAFSRAPTALKLPRTHLNARTHRGLELIPLAQVIHCVADSKYVTVRHTHGETLLDESLKALQEEFGEHFVRIHRNALVSRAHIQHLQRTTSGHYQLHLRNAPEPLSVSRRNVTALRALINNL